MQTKYCKRCNRELPLSMFSKHKNIKDGYAFYCKDCKAKYGKMYRDKMKTNPTYIFKRIKARVNTYKKRGRAKPFLISELEFIQWYNSQSKVCVYCGIEEKDICLLNDNFLKHSTCLSVDCKDNDKGYVLDNLVLACPRCNGTKNNFLSYESMLDIGQRHVKPEWEKRLNKTW